MDLPAFKKGMALLASDLNRLAAQVRASRVTSVIGGKLDVSPGGTSITIAPQAGTGGGGVAASYTKPWELIGVPLADGETIPKFKVFDQSFLLTDANEDAQYIYGVTEGNSTEFELPPIPGLIILKIEFDEYMNILGAWLEYAELTEGFWPSYPDPVERDIEATGANYLRQKYLRIALHEVASTTDPREGPIYSIPQGGDQDPLQVKVIQLVSTDLLLEWQILDGLAAKLAVPWKYATRLTIPPPIP